MQDNSTVAHVIVNNLGGITSLVQNLILYKGVDSAEQELWVLDIKGNQNAPAIPDERNKQFTRHFNIDPKENWYLTYGRLAKKLSEHSGVLVSNDQYDLVMLQAFNLPRQVVQLVHDPYNVQLSLKYHDCIDLFIAHSQYIFQQLQQELPGRAADILHIPYGIPLAPQTERSLYPDKPLQLLFLGRHDQQKGVFDLFAIHQLLKRKNIPVSWVILGKGPETVALKEQWKQEEQVRFHTPASNDEILAEARACDIFVFPTKFEGFPVALLETMSMGCVPIVTDLPGGIRELVDDGITGYKCAVDQNELFAEKVALLHRDRLLLQQMQQHAISRVYSKYNAEAQMPLYQQAFLQLLKNSFLPRHHSVNRKIGSRLDQKWMPNVITKKLRVILEIKKRYGRRN